MGISHHQYAAMRLLTLTLLRLVVHIVDCNTLDLGAACSGDSSLHFCVLANISSTYKDPLVLANSSVQKVRELIIRDSAVYKIPTSVLELCPQLQTFVMHNCGLDRLFSRDFESARSVSKLVIQMNRLINIPDRAFAAMHDALEELYLGHNTLHTVHRNAFAELGNLKYLDVQHNSISSLEGGVLDHLVQLEHIDLSHNKIEIIDVNTFRANHKLATVLLHDNKFSVFEPHSVAHFSHLQQLDISNSVLEEIRVQSVDNMLVQASGLKRLTISGGVIKLNASNNELSFLSVGDKRTVLEVDVHGNRLETLDAFVGMLNLQTLDVSHNHVIGLRTTLSSTSLPLPSLVHLNMAFNRLQNISLDALLLSTKLTTLDLAFNRLMHFDARVFDCLPNLEKLYMEGNRFDQMDYVDLKKSHPFLREIGFILNGSHQILEHDNSINESSDGKAAVRKLVGVSGIHPYWTLKDILALVILIAVFLILLLLFYYILLEEQCCHRRRRLGRGESEPLNVHH